MTTEGARESQDMEKQARTGGDEAAGSDPLLEGLTAEQAQAVVHEGGGPLLILAAAGSGKTTTLTRRIAWLVARQGAAPWSILALTFTNKAAGEMRERVLRLLPVEASSTRGLVVSTFHAFCARLLRRYAEQARLNPDYTIYDESDQRDVIKAQLDRLNLSKSNFPPDMVRARIGHAKNALETVEDVRAMGGDYWSRQFAKIYAAYEEALEKAGAVDFDDLLMKTAALLRDNEEVRDELRGRFQYLLVDEYQDTNHAQFQIAHLLSAGHRQICVVGDPDQSIYGWRGADITNILEFEQHFPEAKVVKLGENFRSTSPILAIADGLIKHNAMRKDKPLFTQRDGGDKPVVFTALDERHEAEAVLEFFENLALDHSLAWKDMAVFYRTNALSRVIEAALRDRGIPYVLVRGTAFYDRKEIRDALAYLRVILNPGDEVSLKRIVNEPTRGIGKTTLGKVMNLALERGVTLFEALGRSREVQGLSARAVGAIERFVTMINAWRAGGEFMGAETGETLATLVKRVLAESGMERVLRASSLDEDAQRLDNLNELVTAVTEFERDRIESAEAGQSDDPFGFEIDESAGEGGAKVNVREESMFDRLRAYLEQVALVSDVEALDPDSGAVMLMTLHAAKGLEFPAVAMVGLEEGLLPHSRSRESETEVEEERRLCFVGITRAKSHLMISHAMMRTVRGMREPTIASRFLDEIPFEFVEKRGADRVSAPMYDPGERDWAGGGRGAAKGRRQRGGHRDGGDQSGTGRSRDSLNSEDDVHVRWSRAAAVSESGFGVGMRVRHPQFGDGAVESVTQSGRYTRVRVKFDHVGMKTLIAEYARLEVIG